jgi:hypothetical protein
MKAHLAGLFLFCLIASVAIPVAHADDDFIVYSPHVTQGQSEVELRGYRFSDGRSSFDRYGAFEAAIAHTFTSWWKTEVYVGEYEYGPTLGTHLAGYEFENTFQLADQGRFWADPGFLLSYVHRNDVGAPDSLEFGPLLEKQSGRIIQRLNLIWEKELGANAEGQYNFRSAYSAGYKVETAFVPGIEAYYRPADNAHQIGPALAGEARAGDRGEELEYSMALLYGVNQGAPDRTFVLRVAYEFF